MRSPESIKVKANQLNFNVYHWQGEGGEAPLFLLHATGFHARCWDQVVKSLGNRDIFAMDIRNHGLSDATDPPYSWPEFAEDVVGVLDSLGIKQVLGVGHSMGGHLITRAAASRPGMFRGLLLLDPVIVSRAHGSRLDQIEGIDHPVARRRNQWKSVEEMMSSLQSKPPYSSWDPEVFRDYCHYGAKPLNGGAEGVQLACHPVREAAIYLCKGVSGVWDTIPSIQVLVRVVRARERRPEDPLFDFNPSPTATDLAQAFPKGEDVHLQDQSHFFPMEDPAMTARLIKEMDRSTWPE